MFIRELIIRNLKLLKELKLSFNRSDGGPRMWTVIIGENGTGKTSILQAIAMAAAGQLQVNNLASKVVGHLRDRRCDDPMEVQAEFSFADIALRDPRLFPDLDGPPSAQLRLQSQVRLETNERSLRGAAAYAAGSGTGKTWSAETGGTRTWGTGTWGTGTWGGPKNPLDSARAANLPLWFVAGYGVARGLPDAGRVPTLDQPSIERMAPLFPESSPLTSTAFANYFAGQADRAQTYARVLRDALFSATELLPLLRGVELRGQGGVRSAGDLQERNRFIQVVGSSTIKVPGNALSHGYASTIAWIADLVGHVLLESGGDLQPHEMHGLVLIDEIDLYLHPTWQVVLIQALRKTFPGLQFVVTTHSPLVLAGLGADPGEIIRLGIDEKTGNVEQIPTDADPRTMTGTEIYRRFFGIDDIYPDPAGAALRDYRYLAANPYRSDRDEQEMRRLLAILQEKQIDPAFEPLPRASS